MPDIVSRIKVEAQGADQAAREILKLKAAYEQAAQAARGLSPGRVGSNDPFAQATSPNHGVMAGGQSNEDVAGRETRNRQYYSQVRDRESANRNYNSMFRHAPGAVSSAFNVAESASQGRGGAALGGIASGLGGLLGGAGGIGLMAVAAGAMGVQRMAENAFGRLQETFGTGMSQRMGIDARSLDRQRLGFARMGAPEQMISRFFSSAGQSGVDFGRGSTQDAVNAAIFGSTVLGLDPSVAASMVGTLNRSNVNAANIMNAGTLGVAQQSFGRPNISMFIGALTDAIQTATARGIEMSTAGVSQSANLIAGLAQYGGMSAQGATAFAGRLRSRGLDSAQLSRPEDVIAFQLMRGEGMSVSDTMLAMEQSPEEVNRRMYQFLRTQTGGDTDALRLRMQRHLGPGTTMSEVDRFLRTQGAMTGDIATDRARLGGAATEASLRAGGPGTDEMLAIFQERQKELLHGLNQSMLNLTTGLSSLMTGAIPFDPASMTTEGIDIGTASRKANAHVGVATLNEMTVQDVSVNHLVIDSAEYGRLNRANQRTAAALASRVDSGTSMATAATLRNNPAAARAIQSAFIELSGSENARLAEVMAQGPGMLGESVGSWGDIGRDLIAAVTEFQAHQLRQNDPEYGGMLGMSRARTAARRSITSGPGGINADLQALGIFDGVQLSDDITHSQLSQVIDLLREALAVDAVNTDGGVP